MSKIGGDMGVKKISFPPPTSKFMKQIFVIFACEPEMALPKNPESFEKIG